MSAKVMGRVWDLDLPHNQLLVLLALADHADHEGKHVFPSLGLIAWKTGYSEQQVRRVLRTLERSKILVAVSRKPGRATEYSINLTAGKLKPERTVTPSKKSRVTKSKGLHFEHSTPDIPREKNEGINHHIEPSENVLPISIKAVYPKYRKDWTWANIAQYMAEHPSINSLVEFYGLKHTLKNLPTKNTAFDAIELFEDLERQQVVPEQYKSLHSYTIRNITNKTASIFKRMEWALPGWIKTSSADSTVSLDPALDLTKAVPFEPILLQRKAAGE